MFANKETFHPIFDYLSTLRHKGKPLMLNKRIRNGQEMEDALALADRYLDEEGRDVSI